MHNGILNVGGNRNMLQAKATLLQKFLNQFCLQLFGSFGLQWSFYALNTIREIFRFPTHKLSFFQCLTEIDYVWGC